METTILLSCQPLGVTDKEFSITHAQRLLDMERKMKVSNWRVTDKKFTVNNGLIERANTGTNKSTRRQKRPDAGDQT